MRNVLILLSIGIVCVPGYGVTVLHFESDPESWVGQGESFTVGPEDGYEFSVLDIFDDGINVGVDNFDTAAPGDQHSWNLLLTPIEGDMLEVGAYTNAERFNSPTNPGLDFFGDGRGNNTLTGEFEILELEFDIDGNVTKLAVDFTQFDEGDPDAGVYGVVRYNSSLGIDGEPALPAVSPMILAAAVVVVMAAGCARLARPRSARIA